MSEVWNAEIRTDEGKGASRRLRHAGKIPAIIYGGSKANKPTSISFAENFVTRVLQDDSIYNSILTINVDGAEEPCIIKDMQRHPATGMVSHIDLQRAKKNTKLIKRVPFDFVGAELAPGVKLGELMTFMQKDVEIRCLSQNLPASITIDVSKMVSGENMRLSDLTIPKGVEIIALTHGIADYDQAVVGIGKPRAAT